MWRTRCALTLICACPALGFVDLPPRAPSAPTAAAAFPRAAAGAAYDRRCVRAAALPAALPVWAIASGSGLIGAAAVWTSSAVAVAAARSETAEVEAK